MSRRRHCAFTALSCKSVKLYAMQCHGEVDEAPQPRRAGSVAPTVTERALWLTGAMLMGAGGLAQISGASRHWMHLVHGTEPTLHLTWASLTLLGFGWPLLILGAAHAGRCGVLVSVFLKAALIAMVMAQVPKVVWPQPRPAAVLDVSQLHVIGEAVVHSGSMPSGHALAVFAMLAAAWLGRSHRGLGSPPSAVALGWCAGLVLAVAVAWSRVAVGAHWPADVLAGAGAGLWVAALAWKWERVSPWGRWFEGASGQRTVCAFLLVAAAAWALTATGYPQVLWLQWMLAGGALAEAIRRVRVLKMTAIASGVPQAGRSGS